MSYISEIQANVESNLSEVIDATAKINYIVNKMRDKQVPSSKAPGRAYLDYFGKALTRSKHPHDDELFRNCVNWFCSYDAIMLQLAIVEDYIKKVEEALTQLEEPIFVQDWQHEKSRYDVMEEALKQEKAETDCNLVATNK